jgi:hypothetical protein
MADSDIVKLIHKFKSDSVQEVSDARAELVKIGKPAIFWLVGEIKTKDIPNDAIMATLAEMPEEHALQGYKFIMSLQEFMPSDVLVETRSMVQTYGIDPDSLVIKEKEKKCVESIDIEIDPTCDRLQMSLEHTFSDKGCYWLYVGMSLYAGDEKLAGYSLNSVTKEAVETVVAKLESVGFSKTNSSNMREWVYRTFMR